MLNMDFSKPVVINTGEMDWIPSPAAGVWRKPLAREDAERGHATSLVRYDPGSSFSAHKHPLGEEILVLEGTFSDATGNFHAGTYFRNPIGFEHAPFSENGCIILVKLHQFQENDFNRLSLDSTRSCWQEHDTGIKTLSLYRHGPERVAMVNWSDSKKYAWPMSKEGLELFVVRGTLLEGSASYPEGTWIRLPVGTSFNPAAMKNTLVWVKSGHLP